MRGIMHWMSGLTLFWLLIVTLWMPWIDYSKTYRQVSASLAKALPENRHCIAGANLADSIIASLDYFDGIRTIPANSATARKCDWLLIHGAPRDGRSPAASGWRKVWDGGRPAERRDSDRLHLYRRDVKRGSSPGN